MNAELERFVASLAIPADRKTVVLAELLDHVSCASEAARREGRDPEAAGREAVGNLELLRRSLEAIEPAFRITRLHAMARGFIASLVMAVLLDQGGSAMSGAVGVLAVIAIAAVCAPPRAFDLLRSELRAQRVRGTVLARGVPIGPALAYAFTVMSVPMLVWVGLIFYRGFQGVTRVDLPISAFAITTAVYLVLLVEGIKARREATT
jgi:hypothetical protein